MIKNEEGNIYGYLTVLSREENSQDRKARWLCQCKCGEKVIVLGKNLRNGNSRSCGCLQKERTIQSNFKRNYILQLEDLKIGELLNDSI